MVKIADVGQRFWQGNRFKARAPAETTFTKSVIELGNSTVCKLAQLENGDFPISVTDSGMILPVHREVF